MSKMTMCPRLAVVVAQPDGGEVEYTIQPDNRDAVRFDMLRTRKGFPLMQEAPVVYMSVLAWSALQREGKVSNDVMDALENQFLSVLPVDDEGNLLAGEIAGAEVDPTQKDQQPAV